MEMDFPLDRVWKAISDAVNSLDWDVEFVDDKTHKIKAATKPGFMAWRSQVSIEAVSVNEKTTRVTVLAEITVTTITAIVSFGQARQRIDSFFKQLSKLLT